MIKILSVISVILAGLSLIIGYTLTGFWPGVIITMTAVLLWPAALWRNRRPVTGLSVIIFMGLAAWGTWLGVAAGWLLFGLVATLVGWDLSDFDHQFGYAAQEQRYKTLQRIHLQRLAMIAGLGLLLSSIALSVQLKLNIWWGILLGVLVIIGLSQAIGRLRRESD